MGAITLNFRKLRQDFSAPVLKEGKDLYDGETIVGAKILDLSADHLRINGKVLGSFDNSYECEIEIDRMESETIHTNCDCSHPYDCQHLAAMLYHLERHLDEILYSFSREADLEEESVDEEILETLREAEESMEHIKGEAYQKELLQEYRLAGNVLGENRFFQPREKTDPDPAELAIVALLDGMEEGVMIQVSLRLPYRSKPLSIPNVAMFLESVRYREPVEISGRRYLFSRESFSDLDQQLLRQVLDHARFFTEGGERQQRSAWLPREVFGTLLSRVQDLALEKSDSNYHGQLPPLPGLYLGSMETPLMFGAQPAQIRFAIETIEHPAPKVFLRPKLMLEGSREVPVEQADLFECVRSGVIVDGVYYRFPSAIKRRHLRDLCAIEQMTIPEPLFGTFIESSLPELQRYAEVDNLQGLNQFVTLPYVGDLEAYCRIGYLDGELDASLEVVYDGIRVPVAPSQLDYSHIAHFVTEEGVTERNLAAERELTESLFQGFVFDEEMGAYLAKTEKKIVEFMTEVIPKFRGVVQFDCPRNLLDQFLYDSTEFKLHLRPSKQAACYTAELVVNGELSGISVDQLWECLASKKAYIDLEPRKPQKRGRRAKGTGSAKLRKILVLDLDRLGPVVQIFDELGIERLEDHAEDRPLWSLVTLDPQAFEGLPIELEVDPELLQLREQILGEKELKASAMPKEIKAKLRNYQKAGVQWLDRLRQMHLNGVLADDMGLGKTLQAIIAITQLHKGNPDLTSLVVCPTSLIYNWKEEFHKFNPKLKVLVVDGTPAQRKKLLKLVAKHDVVITSYSLLQKDVETYVLHEFGYAILDEAQHIKNRLTRNAKSVKEVRARHRLVLTGTPIENSLEEMWSLFDFLMPGLLSSYERFVEKYIRSQKIEADAPLSRLRRKVAPFILRRMKCDVLKDLPPVSEILYHCHLSDVQRELYESYAKSAREELAKLVKKEGFDRVQIHVLATLTRLKQICCHPAIFAKEQAEPGDSSKYDMFLELMQTLIEGKHKAVVFSQYTRMLKIMRNDLEKMGIRYSYLDGSSKDRLEIVNGFNEDAGIPIFLASLKAGGAGLNLTGADTVIHFDRWWNPAVEQQATDRVHRLGQTSSVSSIQFVTLGTIEEKIAELQNRKKGLVQKVIDSDDEVLAKLTWDEVLELLQT